MLKFGREVCRDFEAASQREWLETNGIGGYASGTIAGSHTRRYHGLLVAALHPPVDRYVLLSKLEETLAVGDRQYDLSANQYDTVVHPQGFKYIEQFCLDPLPRWIYDLDGVQLEKAVFMAHGENTTVVLYRVLQALPNKPITLTIRPFISYRDYHSLAHENNAIDRYPQIVSKYILQMHPYRGLPALKLYHNSLDFTAQPDWYRRFYYRVEVARGLDCWEDLFTYGYLSYTLRGRDAVGFVMATLEDYDPVNERQILYMEGKEVARREKIVANINSKDTFVQQLALAADAFLVQRADGGASVIAGYHWFTDWGRDTMISLPGLALVSKRFDTARSIIASFLKYCDQGMLPNRFADNAAPEYNTVDATLWLFHVVREYAQASGDYDFIQQQVFAKLEEIINFHIKGTRYQIKVDPGDGLLSAGAEGVALTWMDARVDGWVVTPRRGKPVEINALWHNALEVMAELSEKFGWRERATKYRQMADRARESFNQAFWNAELNCLYDCIDGDFKDAKIRPNQILAVSLPFPLLAKARQQAVVKIVREKLLTPYGLRSLAPDDPAYIGTCNGDQRRRDSAYHQGIVWSWFIGPFTSAYLKAFGSTDENRQYLLSLIDGFKPHLAEVGLGFISEIFDGDPPYTPRGCIAQAWSVAEILRCYLQELGSQTREKSGKDQIYK